MILKDIIELKEHLLNLGVFINNKYLDNYCKLVYDSLNRDKIKFKTERHHFIPVCYYKNKYNLKTRKDAEKYAKNDENNFLINLLHSEHLKAHIYLSFCFNDLKLTHQNMCTVIRIIYGLRRCNIAPEITLDNLKEFLDDEDLLVEYDKIKKTIALNNSERMKGNSLGCKRKMSQDVKNKLLKSNCGGKYIYKDGCVKHLKESELSELSNYLNDGWKLGNPRAAHKTSKKGTIHITNGVINKYVFIDEFENTYKKQGFYKGFYIPEESNNDRILKMSETMKKRVVITKDNMEKRVALSELSTYLENGWKRGGKNKNKRKENNK